METEIFFNPLPKNMIEEIENNQNLVLYTAPYNYGMQTRYALVDVVEKVIIHFLNEEQFNFILNTYKAEQTTKYDNPDFKDAKHFELKRVGK